MDLEEIRQFIETEGGKCIIVENGKPTLVVTKFADYQERVRGGERAQQEPAFASHEAQELTLEDLPV